MPALLTRISTYPNFSMTSRTTRLATESLLTSESGRFATVRPSFSIDRMRPLGVSWPE